LATYGYSARKERARKTCYLDNSTMVREVKLVVA